MQDLKTFMQLLYEGGTLIVPMPQITAKKKIYSRQRGRIERLWSCLASHSTSGTVVRAIRILQYCKENIVHIKTFKRKY